MAAPNRAVSAALRITLAVALALQLSVVRAPRVQAAGGSVTFSTISPAGWSSFKAPRQLDVAPDGSIWVTDYTDNVVYKLSPQGSVLLTLGTAGTAGSSNDLFSGPWGIAVGVDDRVYIVDVNNKRVQVFSQSGVYLDTIGSQTNPASPVTFVSPRAVDVDSLGNVYVYDYGTGARCVSKITGAGVYASDWATGAAGTLSTSIQDISVDASGVVYMIDSPAGATPNRWVRALASDGTSLTAWGGASAPMGTNSFGICAGTDGLVYVAEGNSAAPRVQVFSKQGVSQGSWGGVAVTGYPYDIAFAPDGTVLTTDNSSTKRIRRFANPGVGATLTAVYGQTSGSLPGQFSQTSKVALAPDGSVWVADTGNRRVQHISASGAYLGLVDAYSGSTFSSPTAVAVEKSGNLLVGDAVTGSVVRLALASQTGTISASLVETVSLAAEIGVPSAIVVSPSETVYVVDSSKNCVHTYQSGSHSRYPADDVAGSADGDFSAPAGMTVAADGSLWVADTGNNRLQQFDAEWNWVRSVGGAGTHVNQYTSPSGLGASPDGTLWVADTGNNRIHHLDAQGAWLEYWPTLNATAGIGSNQFNAPRGVAVTPLGDVYIADTGNNRLMRADVTAPVTRSSGVPMGWVNHDVAVSLDATDLTGATTYHAADGGEMTTYTAPIPFSAEGTHTLDYYSVDPIGWSEQLRSESVRIDRTDPAITVSGAHPGWARDVTLTVDASDAPSGIDRITYQYDGGSEETYSAPFLVTQEGTVSVRATAYDLAGNTSQATAEVMVDRTGPAPFVDYETLDPSYPRVVYVGATDPLSGVDLTYWSIDGGMPSIDPTITVSVPGTHTIDVWSYDMVGNLSATHSEQFVVGADNIPPIGTGFVLASGAEWVGAGPVAVTSDVIGADEMRFDAGNGWTDWAAFAATTTVTLPLVNGEHEVKGQYRDLAGNTSDFTDTVKLDASAPFTTCSASQGQWIPSPATIDFTANDGLGSGVASTWYRIDESMPVQGASVSISDIGTHTVTYWSVDAVGNKENDKQLTIHVGPQPTKFASSGLSTSLITYGSGHTVSVGVRSEVTSSAPTSRTVLVQSSPNGATGWSNVATLTLGSSGSAVSSSLKPADKTYYRAVFTGDSAFAPCTSTAQMLVKVKPVLKTPVMGSTVYRNKTFTAYSLLSPKHSGTCKTQLKFYRLENRKWVLRKTVTGRYYAYGTSTTTTKVQASTTLPYAGSWRVFAYHPADTHESLTSGYKSFTVR